MDDETRRKKRLEKYAYHNKHFKAKNILFSDLNPADMELLEWINQQNGISSYMKGLIREDMEKKKREETEEQET